MRADKTVSEESLQRLWSEIALLRQEIEQAQRDQTASQVHLASAVEVAQTRVLRAEVSDRIRTLELSPAGRHTSLGMANH